MNKPLCIMHGYYDGFGCPACRAGYIAPVEAPAPSQPTSEYFCCLCQRPVPENAPCPHCPQAVQPVASPTPEEMAAVIHNAAKAVREMVSAERLLCDLTPGGSEFYNDPRRCYEFIKARLAQTSRLAQERNEAREALAAQSEAIRELESERDEWDRKEDSWKHAAIKWQQLSKEASEAREKAEGERDAADKLREKCAGLGIEGILEQKRLLAAQKNIIATLGEGKAAAEQRAEKAEARVRELSERLGKPRCLDCNAVGLRNCSHFDNCGGTWKYELEERDDYLAASLRDVQDTLTKQEWATYDQVCPICDEQPHHASCWLSALMTRIDGELEKGKLL